MRRIVAAIFVLPLAAGSVIGCTSRRHDEHAISGEFTRDRDRVVQQTEAKLAELDAKLATLKTEAAARSAELDADSKVALNDAIAKLEAERASAQRAVDEAKTSTAEAWAQAKQRTDDALKHVEDAYDAAASKLRG